MLHTACALPSPLRTAAESLAVALPRHPRVADWFAQLNNKMGGDLKKIQTVGKYLVDMWRAVGMMGRNGGGGMRGVYGDGGVGGTP